MSETPVFQIRTAEAKADVSEVVEKKILGDVTSDQRTIRAIQLNINSIFSNELSNLETIQAVLEQKNSSNGYLTRTQNGADYYNTRNNELIRLNDIKDRKITDTDQKELILSIAKERDNGIKEYQQAVFDKKAFAKNITSVFKREFPDLRTFQAVLEQRTTSGPYLSRTQNGADYYQTRAGEIITVNGIKDRKITDKEQLDFLVGIAETRQKALTEATVALAKKKSFDKNITSIVTNEFRNVETFRAILEQKTTSGPYLAKTRNGSDYYLRREGNLITLDSIKDQKAINDNQRDLLLRIAEIVSDKQIPEEQRGLLLLVLKGDRDAQNRLQLLLKEQNNTPREESINTLVSDIDRFKRQTQLEVEVYQALFDDKGDINKATSIIAAYEGKEETDIQLAARLREKTDSFRSIKLADSFLSSLPDKGSIDSSLQMLTSFGTTPEEQQFKRVLTKIAYRIELGELGLNIGNSYKIDVDPQVVEAQILAATIRPAVDDIDYVDRLSRLKNTSSAITQRIRGFRQINEALKLRNNFQNNGINILNSIQNFEVRNETDVQIQTELVELYKQYVATNRPDKFDDIFREDIEETIKKNLEALFIQPDLGKNVEALRYIRDHYRESLFALMEVFREDPTTSVVVDKYLKLIQEGDEIYNPRVRFKQLVSELEKQRQLTNREKRYIDSVATLTNFNPYLIAVAEADFGVTSEFLRHHLESVSKRTLEGLSDDSYVPLIVVGTGPNGIAAFGEIVRNTPQLAEQTLIIDQGERVGGPFAIPNGPAWELNSANRRGEGGFSLPDIQSNEIQTVRAYGSPVARWYPGERAQKNDIRKGSINTTVDYFLPPDELSNKRYPTNEQLQFILEEQTTLLANKLALRTEILSVTPDQVEGKQGNKIVEIATRDINNNIISTKRIRTDGIIFGSGLGEATYGFKLEGSKAENVIQQTKDKEGFPKISTTLEAFRALADRSSEKSSPGKTLVIWGKGNSADTLIENIGTLFQSENPLVRDVTKIYVIADGQLSTRPRYSLINDLRPRNGRGNLIEFINARVEDVDFASNNPDVMKRDLAFFDDKGKEIKDVNGNPVRGNSGIAATGFKPKLDIVLGAYLDKEQTFKPGQNNPVSPVTLPTNPNISVADSLTKDPNILFVGTASQPRFNLEKLSQLPREAREALLRNGVENAVAIGFRAPDTQAATNIWLNQRLITLPQSEKLNKPIIPVTGEIVPGEKVTIPINNGVTSTIPNNIEDAELFLSPILAYEIGTRTEFSDAGNIEIDFDLQLSEDGKEFELEFSGGEISGVSKEFISALQKVIGDTDFQRYALYSLRSARVSRRVNPQLNLVVSFQSGRLNPRKTFVEKGARVS